MVVKQKIFPIMASLAMFYACQEKIQETAPSDGVPPVVESVSLEEGADDVDINIGTIDVFYDCPIVLADASAISLSDSDGTELPVDVTGMNVKIRVSFGKLQQYTEYTLTIHGVAVISRSGNTPAEDFSVSFTTGRDVDAPINPDDYTPTLVTEDPIPNAVALYEYLISIYGKKSLSSAMAKVDWNTDEAEWIFDHTGKYPAIAFFDYIHLDSSPCNWIDYSDITPVKEWWKAGGLVGAGWHWNVPNEEGGDKLNANNMNFSPANATVSGTWENRFIEADLAELTEYLLALQKAGIPVIWRPLHEAAGNWYTYGTGAWFWWGGDGGEAYVKLWRYMFDYLESRGVKNLIWVWTTQTSKESDKDMPFYPGDEYVDIVGRDIYNMNNAENLASQYQTITGMIKNKMVALSEFGGIPTWGDVWNAGGHWLYFMPWYDYGNDWTAGFEHEFAGIQWWRDTFESEVVLDRSELPVDLFEK